MHRILKNSAAKAGVSLSQYVLSEIRERAKVPTEVLMKATRKGFERDARPAGLNA